MFQFSSVNSITIDAVTTTMVHVIGHVISVDPNQPTWLKTQADVHYGKWIEAYDRMKL